MEVQIDRLISGGTEYILVFYDTKRVGTITVANDGYMAPGSRKPVKTLKGAVRQSLRRKAESLIAESSRLDPTGEQIELIDVGRRC